MRIRVLIIVLFATALSCALAIAQVATFEVASIKSQPWEGKGSVGVFVRGNTLDAEHCSLRDLVEYAYNLRSVQLSGGPRWADNSNMRLDGAQLFQVMAKAPGDTPPSTDSFRQMLQVLLAERFQLKISHKPKELPVYDLVVDKGGPKMKASAPDTKFSNTQRSRNRFVVQMVTTQLTMDRFVQMVESYAGRPIFNKTGLEGGFDFSLDFIPESAAVDPNAPVDAPSFVIAVRQLGLRLEPAMAPLDTIVIESAERPTDN
jgi:uncharacterized protein (TIGR03435 family)